MARLSEDIKKPWLKATLEGITYLISNQIFLVQEPDKGGPVTPFMDVYKAKNLSDGSLDKLKLRILVRGDLKNKELAGGTWSPTASMSNLKYFLADAFKHKARAHQLDSIEAFLQEKVNNRVFLKFYSRCEDYFT